MLPIRVDFYLLNDVSKYSADEVTCRLLEKAYLRGHRVFAYCNDLNEAHALDELLWTFRDDSFVPHNLQGEGPEPPPPIQIGYDSEPRGFDDVLMNLASTIPPFFLKFKRIIEIIAPNEQAKVLGRLRFREYRKHQCGIHTHQI